jgi:hypothetical protein
MEGHVREMIEGCDYEGIMAWFDTFPKQPAG